MRPGSARRARSNCSLFRGLIASRGFHIIVLFVYHKTDLQETFCALVLSFLSQNLKSQGPKITEVTKWSKENFAIKQRHDYN